MKKVILCCCVAVAAAALCFGGYKAYLYFAPSAQVDSAEEVEAEVVEEENAYEIYKREMAAKAQAEADSLAQLQAETVAE